MVMATKKAADEITEPPPTVREAMRFGAFSNAKLVAGAEGLDKPMQRARMIETPQGPPPPGDPVPMPAPQLPSAPDRVIVSVFTIGAKVQMVDPMTPVLERTSSTDRWLAKRAPQSHRRFAELVLDGKGVNEICRTLAELLESAVV